MPPETKDYTDQDAKIAICGIIREIYGDQVANNRPENISPEVIDIVTDAVNRIKSATRAIVSMDVAFNFLYTAPGTIWDVLFSMAADALAHLLEPGSWHDPLQTYVDWFQAIRGKRMYAMAIPVAAAATRSGLELALMGE